MAHNDGTPLNCTLVNIADWCKNTYEVVSQRINTNDSHHRYDVLLLINGVPVAQIELKTLSINPHRAIEQIVEYKSLPNGCTYACRSFASCPQPVGSPGLDGTTGRAFNTANGMSFALQRDLDVKQ